MEVILAYYKRPSYETDTFQYKFQLNKNKQARIFSASNNTF